MPLPVYSSAAPKRCARLVRRDHVDRAAAPAAPVVLVRERDAGAARVRVPAVRVGRDEDHDRVRGAVRDPHVLAIVGDAAPGGGVGVAVVVDEAHGRVAPVGFVRVAAAVGDVDRDRLNVVDPGEIAVGMLARQPALAAEDLVADVVALAGRELRAARPAGFDEDDADRHLTGHLPAGGLGEKILQELLRGGRAGGAAAAIHTGGPACARVARGDTRASGSCRRRRGVSRTS